MSIQKIIQESINKNPLEMKEIIAEELRARVALALEAKMKDDEEEDDMKDEDDEDEDDMKKESFNLSNYTVEELEDFMVSEDFNQLNELDKKTLVSYVKKAAGAGKDGMASNARNMTTAAHFGDDKKGYEKSQRKVNNRSTGIQRAADKLAK